MDKHIGYVPYCVRHKIALETELEVIRLVIRMFEEDET